MTLTPSTPECQSADPVANLFEAKIRDAFSYTTAQTRNTTCPNGTVTSTGC